jgi:hypothetical protein
VGFTERDPHRKERAMRAEAESLNEQITASVSLLRRHL